MPLWTYKKILEFEVVWVILLNAFLEFLDQKESGARFRGFGLKRIGPNL